MQLKEEQVQDPEYIFDIQKQNPGKYIIINIMQYSIDENGKLINKIGHDILIGKDGETFDPNSCTNLNKNDCTYAVTLKLRGKEVNDKNIKDLRSEIAKNISSNPYNSCSAIDAQNWIAEHYPDEAYKFVMSGAGIINDIGEYVYDGSDAVEKTLQDLAEAYPGIFTTID